MYAASMETDDLRCCGGEVRSELPDTVARPLAEQFAALADPNRLHLLDILGRYSRRVCVCDLVAALPLSQPTTSHHLRVLRAAGLVDYVKHGVWAYYYIRPETLAALRDHLAALTATVDAPSASER
jgi:ArsR family transcriptional regulator